jgi:hypothetical protein
LRVISIWKIKKKQSIYQVRQVCKIASFRATCPYVSPILNKS